MDPKIDATEFGSITIGGERYDRDVVIRLDGSVEKRRKKLSKRRYGTSHTVSIDEIRYVFEEGATRLIVGTGQFNALELSDETQDFLREQGCSTELLATPRAIEAWNAAEGPAIGLFHVTC